LELRISEASDWHLFELIALKLEQGLQGIWTQKVDGLDHRYWDLLADGQTLTLHLEHYLGIYLFNAQECHSAELLTRANHLLKQDFPVEFEPGPSNLNARFFLP
jgi:hypothetical protein